MLEKHDMFLKRIEPEIEGITGEERDTASFMKMMRLFNEVKTELLLVSKKNGVVEGGEGVMLGGKRIPLFFKFPILESALIKISMFASFLNFMIIQKSKSL